LDLLLLRLPEDGVADRPRPLEPREALGELAGEVDALPLRLDERAVVLLEDVVVDDARLDRRKLRFALGLLELLEVEHPAGEEPERTLREPLEGRRGETERRDGRPVVARIDHAVVAGQ